MKMTEIQPYTFWGFTRYFVDVNGLEAFCDIDKHGNYIDGTFVAGSDASKNLLEFIGEYRKVTREEPK